MGPGHATGPPYLSIANRSRTHPDPTSAWTVLIDLAPEPCRRIPSLDLFDDKRVAVPSPPEVMHHAPPSTVMDWPHAVINLAPGLHGRSSFLKMSSTDDLGSSTLWHTPHRPTGPAHGSRLLTASARACM